MCNACMRVFTVSTGNMTQCSPMPAKAPASMCCEGRGGTGSAVGARAGASRVRATLRPLPNATQTKPTSAASAASPAIEHRNDTIPRSRSEPPRARRGRTRGRAWKKGRQRERAQDAHPIERQAVVLVVRDADARNADILYLGAHRRKISHDRGGRKKALRVGRGRGGRASARQAEKPRAAGKVSTRKVGAKACERARTGLDDSVPRGGFGGDLAPGVTLAALAPTRRAPARARAQAQARIPPAPPARPRPIFPRPPSPLWISCNPPLALRFAARADVFVKAV